MKKRMLGWLLALVMLLGIPFACEGEAVQVISGTATGTAKGFGGDVNGT